MASSTGHSEWSDFSVMLAEYCRGWEEQGWLLEMFQSIEGSISEGVGGRELCEPLIGSLLTYTMG